MFSAFYWITPLTPPSKEYIYISNHPCHLEQTISTIGEFSGVIISLSSSCSNIVALNNLRETNAYIQLRRKDPPMGWLFLRGAGYSKSSDEVWWKLTCWFTAFFRCGRATQKPTQELKRWTWNENHYDSLYNCKLFRIHFRPFVHMFPVVVLVGSFFQKLGPNNSPCVIRLKCRRLLLLWRRMGDLQGFREIGPPRHIEMISWT